jgi:hypothetical protein
MDWPNIDAAASKSIACKTRRPLGMTSAYQR